VFEDLVVAFEGDVFDARNAQVGRLPFDVVGVGKIETTEVGEESQVSEDLT